jgi:hypothetical protein
VTIATFSTSSTVMAPAAPANRPEDGTSLGLET